MTQEKLDESPLAVDCPLCEEVGAVVGRGSIFVDDKFVVHRAFVCAECQFTAHIEVDRLQDALALKGRDYALERLSTLIRQAYGAWRMKRKAAGLDA